MKLHTSRILPADSHQAVLSGKLETVPVPYLVASWCWNRSVLSAFRLMSWESDNWWLIPLLSFIRVNRVHSNLQVHSLPSVARSGKHTFSNSEVLNHIRCDWRNSEASWTQMLIDNTGWKQVVSKTRVWWLGLGGKNSPFVLVAKENRHANYVTTQIVLEMCQGVHVPLHGWKTLKNVLLINSSRGGKCASKQKSGSTTKQPRYEVSSILALPINLKRRCFAMFWLD